MPDATYKLSVNGQSFTVTAQPDTPLLWVLRDKIGLTGTKYGCGLGICGACMVIIDKHAVPACQIPISEIPNKNITTIEGLAQNGLTRIQKIWIDEQVPQCGYCQSGQIMAATALFLQHKNPTEQQISQAMSAVLCRCGTYQRIRAAISKLTLPARDNG